MKKILSYSVEAANVAFDITTKQPQLFVCRDFQHLRDVLEEFASKMAFITGLEGTSLSRDLNATANTATLASDVPSGLQVGERSVHRK